MRILAQFIDLHCLKSLPVRCVQFILVLRSPFFFNFQNKVKSDSMELVGEF